MLKIKKLREIVGVKVFTDSGDYFGEIEEVNLLDNKVDGWRIKIARDSSLASAMGAVKGIIVPHQFVKAIGEIVIVNKSVVPTREEEIQVPQEQAPQEVNQEVSI